MKKENVNKRLIESSNLSKKDVLKKYNTSIEGVESQEVISQSRAKYGSNVLTAKKKINIFTRILRALIDPFTMILIILATVSLFLDVILASSGDKDISTIIIILVMFTVSIFLKVYQETKSENAVTALTNMINVSTAIKRNSIIKEQPLDEVVVGDIIVLAAGDIIPANVRIISAKDLFLSEASLTGESHPIEKHESTKDKDASLLERDNLAFMGTNVISGAGIAVAIAVGNDTVFGDISKSVTEKSEKTSFEKGLSSVSWLLIRFMLVMIPFVILINGFGNMFSVIVASLMLPFLPMLPIHLLLLNLIYDLSMLTIPWDNVDEEQIKSPSPWETKSISRFMVWFGPTSSIFDIGLFVLMFYLVLPNALGGSYSELLAGKQARFVMMFHAAWFILSMISQTLIVHLIRSEKTSFIKTRASWPLMTSAVIGTVILVALPYILGPQLNLTPPPAIFYAWLALLIFLYVALTSIIKHIFIKKYDKLI